MAIIFWLLFILYLASSMVLIFVVLLQSGKGGGLSSLVGAGSTLGDTLGASGVEKTLNRWTSYCAIGFLVINILMVVMGPHVYEKNILDKLPAVAAPATGAGAAAPAATTGAEPEAGAPVAGPPATAAEAPAPGAQSEAPAATVPATPAATTAAPATVPAEPAPAPSPAGN